MNAIMCLAAWHYPHRSIADNVRFFGDNGFPYISLHGDQFQEALKDEKTGEDIARAAAEKNVLLTIHYSLPKDRLPETEKAFYDGIYRICHWQEKYQRIRILSFDVPEEARKDLRPYIRFVLETVPEIKIAVEDFGLTPEEEAQILELSADPRFGLLLDAGHLHIRMNGKNDSGHRLFMKSPLETSEGNEYERYLYAFRCKKLPIVEIHLHNNNGIQDEHQWLHKGTLDIGMIAKILKELDYDGVVTIESAPGFNFKCYGKDADEGILKDRDLWQSLLVTG